MESISSFFVNLFDALNLFSTANGLGDHLKGMDIACNDFTNQNIYNIVFLWFLGINVLFLINYYYGFLNRSPFNKLIVWGINMLLSALLVGVVAFFYAHNSYAVGNICPQINISDADSFGFGATAFIYSLLFFFLFSLVIKWKSNNKKIPF
jgi:hypothetical protein